MKKLALLLVVVVALCVPALAGAGKEVGLTGDGNKLFITTPSMCPDFESNYPPDPRDGYILYNTKDEYWGNGTIRIVAYFIKPGDTVTIEVDEKKGYSLYVHRAFYLPEYEGYVLLDAKPFQLNLEASLPGEIKISGGEKLPNDNWLYAVMPSPNFSAGSNGIDFDSRAESINVRNLALSWSYVEKMKITGYRNDG